MKFYKFFLMFVLILPLLLKAQVNTDLKIKYLSSEYVYITGGKADSVSLNDQFEVIRNGVSIATIEVVYTADHSASCKILNMNQPIQAGDRLKWLKKSIVASIVQDSLKGTISMVKEEQEKKVKVEKTRNLSRIRGNIGIQWYHFEDLTDSKLNFDQPTFRINFKAQKLWNRDFNFNIRFRSRKYERSRRFNNDVPASEWRNRIYEASFAYNNADSPINFKIGRIISNMFSGIGYIDGLLLQNNINELWRWGVFAGSRPEWQYSDFQTSIQKYGGYINFLKGDYLKNRWESTLAFSAEYHGSTVSREFLYLMNNYNYKSRLSVYQSLELDYNRDWRKEKTAETISITGLYVSGSYKIFDWLKTGVSYDNRKNYYTYELLKTIADSLFDSAFRQGIRANVYMRYSKNINFYGNFGWRNREGEGSDTYSYIGGLNFSNFLIRRLRITPRFAGFTNYYTSGYNPSVSLTKNFRYGHYIGISAGSYIYTLKETSTNHMNNWLRLNGQLELPWQTYFSGNYEYDWGDDVEGHRILAELGYRF